VTGDRSARRRDTVPPTRGGEREAVAVASQIRTGSALPGRAPAQVRRWGGRGGVCVSAIREEGWVWVRAAGMKSLSVIKKSREVTSRKRETCMFHMFLSSLSRGSTCQSKWVRSFFGDNGFPIPSLLYSIDDNTYNADFLTIIAFMKKKLEQYCAYYTPTALKCLGEVKIVYICKPSPGYLFVLIVSLQWSR